LAVLPGKTFIKLYFLNLDPDSLLFSHKILHLVQN
jgi:hypothetical protein